MEREKEVERLWKATKKESDQASGWKRKDEMRKRDFLGRMAGREGERDSNEQNCAVRIVKSGRINKRKVIIKGEMRG